MVKISWDIKASKGLDLIQSYKNSYATIKGDYSVSYENADFTDSHKLIRLIICAETRKECEHLLQQEKLHGDLKEDLIRGNIGEICYTLGDTEITQLLSIEIQLHDLMNLAGGVLHGCEHINTAWCEIYNLLIELGYYKE